MSNPLTIDRIGSIRKDLGIIRAVIAAADSRAFALYFENEAGDHRLEFGGRICAEYGPHELPGWSLSFDGTRLATAVRRGVTGGVHEIRINGEPAFTAELDTLHRLDWLDSDRLAWDGWNEDGDGRVNDGGVRRFVNGRDVTAELDFEPVLAERGRHAIHVKEGNIAYIVNDDGSRSGHIEVKPDADRHHWFDPLWPEMRTERPEYPEELWDEQRRSLKVSYRGATGPVFDGIETGGGMRSYAFNADRSRVGYLGIRYGGPARALGRAVFGALERLDGEPRGLAKLWAWPAALLFNPYFGLGHAYIEGSKRFVPVNHDRPWKKGYRFASDHFFLPDDRLVVTAYDARIARVVIEEEEGPSFDSIHNVRHLAADNRVSYLGVRDDGIFRITAA